MNDTVATILSASLVGVGVTAELNLMRVLVGGWREERRARAGKRPATASTRGANVATRGSARASGGVVAAAVLFGAVPSGALAQAGAAAQPQPAPQGQPTAGELPEAPAPLVISTDRPSFSDTTGIVPTGHLQLETGYTFALRSRDGVRTERHNGPELLARVGIIDDRFELRATTSGYGWSRTDDGSGSGYTSGEGFNDAALGFKLKLTDQDGALPRLALLGFTTVGAGSREISSRRAEPTGKLIWSYDLEKLGGECFKGFGVYGNFNIAYPTTNGERCLQGAASICGTYAISSRLGVFAEYYVVGPTAKGTNAAHSVDFGTAYLIGDRVQLDARVGFGLNRAADNMFAGVGISFLF